MHIDASHFSRRINCKLYSWNFGLIGFYTPKFQKLDFTLWSLVTLAIHHQPPPSPPQLVSVVKWHIIMLMCLIFFQISLKTTLFWWWPSEELAQSKLCSFKPKLKIQTSPLNDIVSGKKSKIKHRTTKKADLQLDEPRRPNLPNPSPPPVWIHQPDQSGLRRQPRRPLERQ